MLVLIAIVLALLPSVAILYPFLRRDRYETPLEDESSPQAELQRRLDAALAGLKSAELERGLGNLSPEDYQWIREHYLNEGARVMKAMELEEREEQQMMAVIERQVEAVRRRTLGADGIQSRRRCSRCSSPVSKDGPACPACGQPLSPERDEGKVAEAPASGEAGGE